LAWAVKFTALFAGAALLAAAVGIGLRVLRAPEVRKIRQAHEVVDRIGAFQARTGRLPSRIEEIEPRFRTDEGPVYFSKTGSGHYLVWIGLGLGESYVYDSRTHEWY
jgi:hypothetical protein